MIDTERNLRRSWRRDAIVGTIFHAIRDGSLRRKPHLLVRMAIDVARWPYAWPGGYVRGLIMADGGILCPRCVRENIWEIARDTRDAWSDTGWTAMGMTHAGEMDDQHTCCDHCGRELQDWD